MGLGTIAKSLGRGFVKTAKVSARVGAKGVKVGTKASKRLAKASKRIAKAGTKGTKKIVSKIKANPKLAAKLTVAGVGVAVISNALIDGRNLDIESISNENEKIMIVTKKRHKLEKGEEFTLKNTNSEPLINGDYIVESIKDDKTIYIEGSIQKDGTEGVLNKDYTASELVSDGIVDSLDLAKEVVEEAGDAVGDIGLDIFDWLLQTFGIDMDGLKMGGIVISSSCILSIIIMILLKFS